MFILKLRLFCYCRILVAKFISYEWYVSRPPLNMMTVWGLYHLKVLPGKLFVKTYVSLKIRFGNLCWRFLSIIFEMNK